MSPIVRDWASCDAIEVECPITLTARKGLIFWHKKPLKKTFSINSAFSINSTQWSDLSYSDFMSLLADTRDEQRATSQLFYKRGWTERYFCIFIREVRSSVFRASIAIA